MHENNTPIPSNADNDLQWCVGMLTGISWRVYIQHTPTLKYTIFQI